MIDAKYLDAIKSFEGFTPRAKWDYAQSSNGYGTKAQFEGEIIDRNEADRRFKAEIKAAYDIVERFAPNLDDGSKAALTSLTYNAGTAWTKSGLGNAIRSGDIEAAKVIFQQYNKAGGAVLAGLESRRNAEMTWFDKAASVAQQTDLPTAPPGTEAPTALSKLPEIANLEADIVAHAASEIARSSSSASNAFTGGQKADSIIDRSSPQLRRDAALTLASILSILSMSHLDRDGVTTNDESSTAERRASEIINGVSGSAT